MSRFSMRPLRRHAATSVQLSVALIAVFFATLVGAQEADPYEELLQRIEQLEADKSGLEERLQHIETTQVVSEQAAYDAADPNAVVAEGNEVRTLVDAAFQEQDADRLAALDAQDRKISSLEKAWKAFQAKSTEKKYPNVQVNGVFQVDSGWFHQNEGSFNQYGDMQDGIDFRRARLAASGSVTPNMNYFFQMDFGIAGISRPQFTDVWLEQTDVPLLGNVRVGQWKQPFSLEVVSSFRYTTFMERSTMFQAFTPFRHAGTGFYDVNKDQTATWAASVFRSGQDNFGDSISDNGGIGTAERVTWLPYWECEGVDYLHLGAGHYFNSPPNHSITFRSIPEMFIGQNVNAVGGGTSGIPGPTGAIDGTPFFVSTGPLDVTYYNVVGAEFLWVAGPLSVQSEAMVNFVNQAAGNPNAILEGVYGQVGYFLTGEHRPYNRKNGQIDRVQPKHPLRFCCEDDCEPGWGAWEVAFRYSFLDLDDENIAGGTITDYTFGVNWYLNAYMKTVFNYIHSMPNVAGFPDSRTDLFGLRAQIDF